MKTSSEFEYEVIEGGPQPWLSDFDNWQANGYRVGVRRHTMYGREYLVLMVEYAGCPICGGPVWHNRDDEGRVIGIRCDRCDEAWGDY